jgi:hypothetical protein
VWSGIVFYDAYMFFVHVAMHDVSMLRSWHARHHDTTSSLGGRKRYAAAFSHSLDEYISVQRFTPWGIVKSRLARFLHNIICHLDVGGKS